MVNRDEVLRKLLQYWPVTVFAPTNDAIEKSNEWIVGRENKVVSYHVRKFFSFAPFWLRLWLMAIEEKIALFTTSFQSGHGRLVGTFRPFLFCGVVSTMDVCVWSNLVSGETF
ncbi:hypothetical protein TNCT_66331 [Trichonephila clavata]|uniref:Uncharacterized protein n=1 Tax=Trichonephila clavata TaxID=2740835 RepID=A0A8X6IJ13_TRICU|nr:hypothetical protein TNCT_66331 [Trichonephila clavata]